MAFAAFSATKSKTGGALIVKQSRDHDTLFALFKQVNFDQNNKKNNFDWKTPINVKMSEDELGDFLRAIRTNGESKFYHEFDGNVTTGSFRYYEIKDKEDATKPPRCGFGLSVTKGENTIKVSLSLGAAERFSEYLKFSMNKVFELGFIEDVKKDMEFQEKLKNKSKESPKPAVVASKPAPEEPSDNVPDF